MWKNNKWEVFTTVFSDFDKLIPIGGVFDENPLQTKVKKLPIKRLENSKVNINNLVKKRKLINQDLQRIENSEIYLNNIIPDRDNNPEQCLKRIDSSKHALSCQIRPYYSIEE